MVTLTRIILMESYKNVFVLLVLSSNENIRWLSSYSARSGIESLVRYTSPRPNLRHSYSKQNHSRKQPLGRGNDGSELGAVSTVLRRRATSFYVWLRRCSFYEMLFQFYSTIIMIVKTNSLIISRMVSFYRIISTV